MLFVITLQNLTTAVGCSSPNKERYLFLCVISMKTCDEVSTEVDVNVNLHGSLIVQNIFKFKKPQKVIYLFIYFQFKARQHQYRPSLFVDLVLTMSFRERTITISGL